MSMGSGEKRICRCCIRIRAGVSVRVRIRVRKGVRISNSVKGRVKLVNYSFITALRIVTSAYPLIHFLPMANVNLVLIQLGHLDLDDNCQTTDGCCSNGHASV